MSHEKIRTDLEASLPAMEFFVAADILTAEEAHEITQTRTQTEYKLHSRVPLMRDFYGAIAFETNLEDLVQARTKALGLKKHKFHNAIRKRIDALYNRALFRTKSPEEHAELVDKYLTYLSEARRSVRLTNVVARLLQRDPTNATLWVHGASKDFAASGNVVRVRNMLQRAIRLLPKSLPLYRELFRVEVAYISALVATLRQEGDPAKRREGIETIRKVAVIPVVVYETAVDKCPDASYEDFRSWVTIARVPWAAELLEVFFQRLMQRYPAECAADVAFRAVDDVLVPVRSLETVIMEKEAPTPQVPDNRVPLFALAAHCGPSVPAAWNALLTALTRVPAGAAVEVVTALVSGGSLPSKVAVLPDGVGAALKAKTDDKYVSHAALTVACGVVGAELGRALFARLVKDSVLGPLDVVAYAAQAPTPKAAKEALEIALKAAAPDSAEHAHVTQAIAHHTLVFGDFDDAVKQYRKALRTISPIKNPDVFSAVARVYLTLEATAPISSSSSSCGADEDAHLRNAVAHVLQFGPTPSDVLAFVASSPDLCLTLAERRSHFEAWVTSAHGRTSDRPWLSYMQFEHDLGELKKMYALQGRAARTLVDGGVGLSVALQAWIDRKSAV